MARVNKTKKAVNLTSYLADAKVVYGAIQQQVSRLPAVMNLIMGERETHRWYECGAEYFYEYAGNMYGAMCRKYAGHPGRHAMRRRTSTNEKLGKRA